MFLHPDASDHHDANYGLLLLTGKPREPANWKLPALRSPGEGGFCENTVPLWRKTC